MRRPEPDRRDAAPVAPEAEVGSQRERDLVAQLAAVQEALGAITWVWDVPENRLRWEGEMSRFLGLPAGSFGGRYEDLAACMHPDERAASRQRVLDCLKGVTPSYRAEGRICWPDGSVRWVEIFSRARYGPDGRALQLVGFIRDVTERRRARLAVVQERDRANNYLRLMESILVALDENGHVTLLNRKGHQTLGYREGELIGRNWYEVCAPPHTRDSRHHLFREMMAGRQEIFEYHESKIVTKAGEPRVIAWRSAEILDDDGHRIGTLSAGEDVTERRRAEQALREFNASLEVRVAERTRELELINAELAVARDAAEAATRAKGNFLANMSHEIRTPMNAILGLTDLARRTPGLPGTVQSYLGKVRRAGDSLMVIINDILDFSKIESGKLAIEAGEFALEDVLDRLSALVGIGAGEKGLEFPLTVAPEVPARLVGDGMRLGQILLNLCGNAVKFTERGEIALSVHALPCARTPSGRVALRFAVRDTGIGMNEAQIARLFQPFDQLDASTTRRFGGTGLGLAICKQLVALMGGEIGVRSEPGEGSEFHFSLDFGLPEATSPLAAGAARGHDAAPEPGTAKDRNLLRGKRILLVEDNELNQMVAHDLISALTGAVVSIAANGQEALERLHAQAFDLVLMDVQMPVMDGYEATRRLRAEPLHAGLPVVAMTAHAMQRDRDLCLAAGMNDFISKPFEPRELLAVLSRWLQPAPGGEAALAAAPTVSPAPAALAVDQEPEAVRFDLGLHRCLDRRDLYDKIVRRFLDTRGGDGLLMRDALARGDHKAATLMAHSQVSTAATVGAEALSEAARSLQQALQAGAAARLPALATAFDHHLGRAVVALRQHLAGTA